MVKQKSLNTIHVCDLCMTTDEKLKLRRLAMKQCHRCGSYERSAFAESCRERKFPLCPFVHAKERVKSIEKKVKDISILLDSIVEKITHRYDKN